MTQTSAPHDTAVHHGPRWRAAVPLLAVLSLVMVGALALTDSARASSHEAMRSLRFGRPINWILQDQTSMDPPSYPRNQPFMFPWEHSVEIDMLPLLLNFTLVLAILIGLYLTIRVLASRR